MYNYTYDAETGGILLNTSPLQFSKEPRPVYYRELDHLGFDKHWDYKKQDEFPYMWAEANKYYYFGRLVAQTIPDDKNIIYIDTTPTPFGTYNIDQYAEYMASSEIQRGKDNAAADDMLRKGKMVAGSWGNRIYNGQIIIYSKSKPEGERYTNWQQALIGLRDLVKLKYPQAFEFTPALTEVTLQSGSKQQWVEAGITEKSGGLTASAEKIVNKARKEDEYWVTDPYSGLGIIKNALDKKIKTELDENSKISIKDILSFLTQAP